LTEVNRNRITATVKGVDAPQLLCKTQSKVSLA